MPYISSLFHLKSPMEYSVQKLTRLPTNLF